MLEALGFVYGMANIGASIAVLSATFTAVGQGTIAAQAIESIARQPESRSAVTSTMFIGIALSETGGIYGLLISILLMYANPLTSQFVELIKTLPQ